MAVPAAQYLRAVVVEPEEEELEVGGHRQHSTGQAALGETKSKLNHAHINIAGKIIHNVCYKKFTLLLTELS